MIIIIACWMILDGCPGVVWCQRPCRGRWRLRSVWEQRAVSLPLGVTHTGGATLGHTLALQSAQSGVQGMGSFPGCSRPWWAAKYSSKCKNNERKGKKETQISTWLWNPWFCTLSPNPSMCIELIFAGEVLHELKKKSLYWQKRLVFSKNPKNIAANPLGLLISPIYILICRRVYKLIFTTSLLSC